VSALGPAELAVTDQLQDAGIATTQVSQLVMILYSMEHHHSEQVSQLVMILCSMEHHHSELDRELPPSFSWV
jgi:hypothetical protein